MKLIKEEDILRHAHDVTLANGAKHRCIDATVIYEIPAVDAVPVEFIESEIKRMELELYIAMSEDDDETAERWIIRKTTLELVLEKWRRKRKEE